MSERPTVGPLGIFPVRLPLGKIAGLGAATLLLPVWWQIGLWCSPKLQAFYLGSYYKSGLQSAIPNPRKVSVQKPYQALMDGKVLVTEPTMKEHPERVREQTISVDPQAFHEWLNKWVYEGDGPKRILRIPITLGILFGGVLLVLGGEWDRRRRLRARLGAHVRGSRKVDWKTANKEALRDGAKPGIEIPCGANGEKLIIPQELEAYHINISAGTGMGKSTLIRHMLYQIEARGDVAIIYDTKGEFRDEFYNEERGDWILDPTDDRCPYWVHEEESEDEAQGMAWGQAWWPDEVFQQPFFKRHPRKIYAYLSSRYSVWNEPEEPATCARLGYWLTHPKELIKRVKGTEAEIALAPGGKEQTSPQSQGLLTTLGEIAVSLRMLPQTDEGRRRFSVRDYSKKRKGWIYMTSTSLTQEALRPWHSAMIDMLILSNQTPAPALPKIWFILDEVATLQRLPQLESGMTKQRWSGNPIVLGFHDLPQLRKIYGDGHQTIIGQAFTNMVLRTSFAQDLERGVFGYEEIEKVTENRPAHLMWGHKHNRSSSWSNHTVPQSPVVSASEIQALPRFTGYFIQEGRVVDLNVQPLPQRKRTERIERAIPPLIFREEPDDKPGAEHVAMTKEEAEKSQDKAAPAPVDDAPPEPFRAAGPQLVPEKKTRKRNPLTPKARPDQLNLEGTV